MALPANGDVPLLLSRLRPSAKWGWKGGAANNPENVVWRDSVQIEPLLAEYETEWIIVEAEEDVKQTNRIAHKNSLLGTVGVDINALTPPQLGILTREMLRLVNAVDGEDEIKSLDTWSSVADLL